MVGDRDEIKDIRLEEKQYAVGVVNEAARQLGDVDAQTVIRGGDTHQITLDYAKKNNIDMIVLGTDERTVARRSLFPGVEDKIFQTADVPVVTVRDTGGSRRGIMG